MAEAPVIVTGFRPFLKVANNPSALLVQSLRDEPVQALNLGATLLDTVYRDLPSRIGLLLDRRPSTLILTGFSAIASGLKIETRATSRCSPAFADADGFMPPPTRDPVLASANRTVTFPDLIDALRAAGVPATLSDDAGAYVCNAAYYHALDQIAKRALPTRALFVHLPAITGMSDPPEGSGVSMSLATMRRGIGIIAETLTSREGAQQACSAQP